MTLRSSATEWLTAVRGATRFSSVSSAIAPATSTVPSLLDPPAPYVTETNAGLSCSSRRTESQNCRCPCSVLGAKNSNENDRPVLSKSVIRGAGLRARRFCWDASDACGCRGFGGMCPSITQWPGFCAGPQYLVCPVARFPGHAEGVGGAKTTPPTTATPGP